MKKLVAGAGALVAVALSAWLAMSPEASAQTPAPYVTWLGPGASIGVTVRDATAEDANSAKLESPSGVVVESVRAGSPAEKAGLRSGDLVVEFDGQRVRSVRHFSRLVEESVAGREVGIVVMRQAQRQTLSVAPEGGGGVRAFAGRPGDLALRLERLPRNFNFDLDRQNGLRIQPFATPGLRLGVSIVQMSDQLSKVLGAESGVLVMEVGADTPAAAAGIMAGDVISLVGGRIVNTAGDIAEALRGVDAQGSVDVVVVRNTQKMTLKVTFGAAAPSGGSRFTI